MALGNGAWTDLVGDFVSYTSGVISPDIFKRWSAISMIAGGLERRVWAKVGDYQTFPNLYILLVAAPGIGKQVIETVQDLWTDTSEMGKASSQVFHVAPDGLTKASLLDTMAESKRAFLPPSGALMTYHSLLVAAEEFGVLLPGYDQEFISNLNKIYNNNRVYRERRRTGSVRKLEIEFPQLNILGGATPAYFQGTFPEEAWTTGLSRRIIMVYSSESPFKELFVETPDLSSQKARICHRLSHIASLYGSVKWTEESVEVLSDWHRFSNNKGGPPVPTHSKLEHYTRSRVMHVTKLAIISAISRTGELVIELVDVKRAIAWLLEAEISMPDIFRAMAGRSDFQVIEEMYYFVQADWARSKQKAVPGDRIRRFLMTRIPHDKVRSLMEAADAANIIARVAGTQDSRIPKPKHEHDVE